MKEFVVWIANTTPNNQNNYSTSTEEKGPTTEEGRRKEEAKAAAKEEKEQRRRERNRKKRQAYRARRREKNGRAPKVTREDFRAGAESRRHGKRSEKEVPRGNRKEKSGRDFEERDKRRKKPKTDEEWEIAMTKALDKASYERMEKLFVLSLGWARRKKEGSKETLSQFIGTVSSRQAPRRSGGVVQGGFPGTELRP